MPRHYVNLERFLLHYEIVGIEIENIEKTGEMTNDTQGYALQILRPFVIKLISLRIFV